MNSYVESGTNSTWWQTVRCPGLRPGGSQTEKCHISVNFGFTKKNEVAELFQIMTSIQKCTKTSNIPNIMCTGFFLLQGGQNCQVASTSMISIPIPYQPSCQYQNDNSTQYKRGGFSSRAVTLTPRRHPTPGILHISYIPLRTNKWRW
jgi:hypothetical protein